MATKKQRQIRLEEKHELLIRALAISMNDNLNTSEAMRRLIEDESDRRGINIDVALEIVSRFNERARETEVSNVKKNQIAYLLSESRRFALTPRHSPRAERIERVDELDSELQDFFANADMGESKTIPIGDTSEWIIKRYVRDVATQRGRHFEFVRAKRGQRNKEVLEIVVTNEKPAAIADAVFSEAISYDA